MSNMFSYRSRGEGARIVRATFAEARAAQVAQAPDADTARECARSVYNEFVEQHGEHDAQAAIHADAAEHPWTFTPTE